MTVYLGIYFCKIIYSLHFELYRKLVFAGYIIHYIIREKSSQVLGKDWRKYSKYSEDFPCIFPDGFNIMVSSIRKA